MILFDVLKKFDTCCEELLNPERRLLPLPPGEDHKDLLRFVKTHERRQICLQNICDQVQRFERGFVGSKHTQKRVNQIIAAGAQLFVLAVIEHRRQHNLSRAEQLRLASEGQRLKDAQDLVSKDVTHVRTIEEQGRQTPETD